MAEITIDGEVNVNHLGHLLDGKLGDLGMRVIGPDPDGQTVIRADGVGEKALREALAQVDPAWQPPAPTPEPDPLDPVRDKLAKVPAGPVRDALAAVLDALDRT